MENYIMAKTNGKSHTDLEHLSKLGTHKYHNRSASVRMRSGKVQKTQSGRSFVPSQDVDQYRRVTAGISIREDANGLLSPETEYSYVNTKVLGAPRPKKDKLIRKSPKVLVDRPLNKGDQLVKNSDGDLVLLDSLIPVESIVVERQITIECNGITETVVPEDIYPV